VTSVILPSTAKALGLFAIWIISSLVHK